MWRGRARAVADAVRRRGRRITRRVRGQSDTTGLVILAAIAVVLAGAIGFFLFSNTLSEGDETVIVGIDSEVNTSAVTISHESGDTLDPEVVSVLVESGGRQREFELAASPAAGDQFSAGDSWTLGTGTLGDEVRVVVVHGPTNTILHERDHSLDGGATPRPSGARVSALDIAEQGANATISEGDSESVAVNVTNTGDQAGSFAVTVELGQFVTETRATGRLAVNETERVVVANVTGGLPDGAYEVRASTANDTTTGTLTVEQPPTAALSGLDIAGQGTSATVTEGDDENVSVAVTNVGDQPGSFGVTLALTGTETESTGTLGSGDSERVTFQSVTGELGVGEYDVTVSTADDSVGGSLSVGSAPTPERAIAYGSDDQRVYVHNGTNWTFTAELDDAAGDVNTLAWSPDGSRLAYGSVDGTAYVVDVEDWTVETQLTQAGGDEVRAVAWSPDGSRLAYSTAPGFGGDNGTVYVHETGDWSTAQTLTTSSSGVWSLSWSPDGSQLAYATSDGVSVRETGGWTEVANLTGPGYVDSVAFSPDNSQLAAGTLGGEVSVYGTGDWTVDQTVDEASAIVRSLAWSPDGSRLVYSAADTAYVHATDDWTVDRTLTQATGDVWSVAWAGDNSTLAYGSTDGTAYLHDTDDWQLAESLDRGNEVRSVALFVDNG